MKDYILEACVDSVESAIIATNAGANRLELCSNLMIGGTTPTAAVFQEVRRKCTNRIHVLIRPRFGDFCYSDHEFQIIVNEIKQFRKLGAEGVVIGILNPDGTLNQKQMEKLIREAGNMSITLHRAFDVCKDPFEALQQVKNMGIHTILTSGQKNSCLEGEDCLKELVARSAGSVDIMAGGGTCGAVIEKLYEKTGISSYHMSGKTVLDSKMEFRKTDVHMGLDSISEFDIWQADYAKIEDAVKVLKKLSEKKRLLS